MVYASPSTWDTIASSRRWYSRQQRERRWNAISIAHSIVVGAHQSDIYNIQNKIVGQSIHSYNLWLRTSLGDMTYRVQFFSSSIAVIIRCFLSLNTDHLVMSEALPIADDR